MLWSEELLPLCEMQWEVGKGMSLYAGGRHTRPTPLTRSMTYTGGLRCACMGFERSNITRTSDRLEWYWLLVYAFQTCNGHRMVVPVLLPFPELPLHQTKNQTLFETRPSMTHAIIKPFHTGSLAY